MAVNTKGSCKICKGKHRKAIERKLISGSSISSIATQYNLSRTTINKHKKLHMASSMFKDIEEVRDALSLDVIKERVNNQSDQIEKLIAACDLWLQDPDDPTKYFVGLRSDEIEVSYNDIDDNGRRMAMKRKATLQELIERIEASDRFALVNIETNMTDPRILLLKAIKEQNATVASIAQMIRNQTDWMRQKEIMDKALKDVEKSGGTITIQEEIKEISKSVSVALEGSDDLCDLMGLD